jgi:hypothetical protein
MRWTTVEFAVSITHHDHAYVDRRGGPAFYSHVRGAAGRAMYRERALRRAEAMYEQAAAAGESAESICGAGLIVLQRAALAGEDLGALLYALAEDDPEAAADADSTAGREIWSRLTGANVPALRAVFADILKNPTTTPRAFRLPPDAALDSEDLSGEAKAAARVLRERTARRWVVMLARVAAFWLNYGDTAKSTMHGFAAIAGRQITEPPGAGVLGEGVVTSAEPFVVMVNSSAAGNNVSTPLLTVQLDSQRVRGFRRAGSTAVKLTHELCETLATGIEGGYAYGIPPRLEHRLTTSEREALRVSNRET